MFVLWDYMLWTSRGCRAISLESSKRHENIGLRLTRRNWVEDLRFSRRWLWRTPSSGTLHRVVLTRATLRNIPEDGILQIRWILNILHKDISHEPGLSIGALLRACYPVWRYYIWTRPCKLDEVRQGQGQGQRLGTELQRVRSCGLTLQLPLF
jgi:hypothetical protein